MTEYGFIEKPIIHWLAGDDTTDPGLGWIYRDKAKLAKFARPLENPLTEKLLIKAVLKINDKVKTKDQARSAVALLQKTINHPDRLTANRETLNLLRDGATLVLEAGKPACTVQFIAFEPKRQHLNDFTCTNQYTVKGSKAVRADTVLLVNGIPLVLGEYKSYISSGKDWTEGVRQLHRYQCQAPSLLAANIFSVAADEDEFRYGTVLFDPHCTKEDVAIQTDHWGRWLSLYPEQKGFWNLPEADERNTLLETGVRGMLRLKPAHILDFLQHFVTFEAKTNKVTKKVARYQQFEAANDMADRVLENIGKPVQAQDRTGLIWHTQGSGKSLTMIFTAYKLRQLAALHNPTVLIVVDRRDLKTQISDDFDACDYPNVEKALGVQDLKHRLKTNWRGTLITTIQAFQKMDTLSPLQEDNIISLVDEAHRSQQGKSNASYAMTMRVKLPNAFRFGLTGTPIDRTMTNTHRDFGPMKDGKQERYLSYYGIGRAVKDGATLEVHYQMDRVPLQVDEEALDIGFEKICKEMELEDEQVKDFVQRQRSAWRELARKPERIDIVLNKMLEHFLAYPDPNGFKAQLVCVDRTACVRYKDALDEKLKARNLPPEWSEVIISAAQNDEEELERFHYSKDYTDGLLDYFRLTPAQWETWNHEKYGDDRSKWRPPLKFLIVCDRLLTGFDAPALQVQYLDKPLRDHNLLQAIARTNRPMPAMGKRTGVVVDFFGVFRNLEKALNFDENIREEALIDWEALKATVPEEVKACMVLFKGFTIEDSRECLLAARRVLSTPEASSNFEQNFRNLNRLWEAVSPDPCLYPLRFQYKWLTGVYIDHRRSRNLSKSGWAELSAKTRALIEEFTEFREVVDNLPIIKIDSKSLADLDKLPSPADKAAALEAALSAELAEDGEGFSYRKLGARLRKIKKRKDASDEAAAKRLKELEAMAQEMVRVKEEPNKLSLTGFGEYAMFAVLRDTSSNTDTDYLTDSARRMVAHLNEHQLLTQGWHESKGGRMRVEQSLLAESWNPFYADLGFDQDDGNPPFLKPAVEALVDEAKVL